MLDLAAIRAAEARLSGHVRQTPLLNAPLLDRVAGRRVFVKAESLQLTGSFKFRGAWSAMTALGPGTRERGVLAYSSGNHGQGVALAAARLGVAATILMPGDAPLVKIDNCRAYGARVVTYDRRSEDRDAIGAAMASAEGLHLIKPFDDPDVIAGQASVGLELASQARAEGIGPAPVLVPCGGGGLTSGIALALAGLAPELCVRPVEPFGFDDAARSLAKGQRLGNAAPAGSICDAILTPMPGEITFPLMLAHCGPGLVVTEDQVRSAMVLAFTHLRLVLEPGGAAGLAAALFAPGLGDSAIAIASGGNVDPALFADCLARAGG